MTGPSSAQLPGPTWRRRASRLAVLLGLAVGAAVLAPHTGAASAVAPTAASPTSTSVPPSASPTATASPAGAGASPASDAGGVDGRQVFLRDCAWCHGNAGGGTQFGPSLGDAGAAAADFYLRTGRMPLESPDDKAEAGPPAYDDRTITALVGYVAGLGKGEPLPPLEPGDPVMGRGIFLDNCAACHSSSGTGVIVSGGQDAPQLYDTPPEQVAEAVRVGPGPMPRFSHGQLTDGDLADVVAYVDQLGPQQVKGGASLDQFGPIAEGTFAIFVGLPLVVVGAMLLGKRAKR